MDPSDTVQAGASTSQSDTDIDGAPPKWVFNLGLFHRNLNEPCFLPVRHWFQCRLWGQDLTVLARRDQQQNSQPWKWACSNPNHSFIYFSPTYTLQQFRIVDDKIVLCKNGPVRKTVLSGEFFIIETLPWTSLRKINTTFVHACIPFCFCNC